LLTFGADAGARVRALVDAERKCCPFLSYDLRKETDQLRLRVIGPPGSVELDAIAGTAEADDVPSAVRERYRALAQQAADGNYSEMRRSEASCCGTDGVTFGGELYGDDANGATNSAVEASLGCGVPTAVAGLHLGEVVLDLGSGAGADVLISAKRVGPTGHVYGLDVTEEMLALARRHQREAGVDNVEWLHGEIEDIPLPDASVDVVLSNCVINLSADKPRVLHEAARVLRPGGRLAVSDVIADPDMDDAIRADLQAWTGCIAGALTRDGYERYLGDAGFAGVEITETHRVHSHASSAIVRARRP
jgi:arsenite methyltransferase